jgi:hypothetical protein
VLALRPELVHEPRPGDDAPGADPRGFYRPYRAEYHGSRQRIDGYTDSPAHVTAAYGPSAPGPRP